MFRSVSVSDVYTLRSVRRKKLLRMSRDIPAVYRNYIHFVNFNLIVHVAFFESVFIFAFLALSL